MQDHVSWHIIRTEIKFEIAEDRQWELMWPPLGPAAYSSQIISKSEGSWEPCTKIQDIVATVSQSGKRHRIRA